MSDISVRAVDPAAATSVELERARQERITAQTVERADKKPEPSTHQVAPLPPLPEIHQGQVLSKMV